MEISELKLDHKLLKKKDEYKQSLTPNHNKSEIKQDVKTDVKTDVKDNLKKETGEKDKPEVEEKTNKKNNKKGINSKPNLKFTSIYLFDFV